MLCGEMFIICFCLCLVSVQHACMLEIHLCAQIALPDTREITVKGKNFCFSLI